MQIVIEFWTLIANRTRLNGTRREALMVDHDAPTGAVAGNESLGWDLAEAAADHPETRRSLGRGRLPTDAAIERIDWAVVGSRWHICGDQVDLREELVSPKVVIGGDFVGQSLREEA